MLHKSANISANINITYRSMFKLAFFMLNLAYSDISPLKWVQGTKHAETRLQRNKRDVHSARMWLYNDDFGRDAAIPLPLVAEILGLTIPKIRATAKLIEEGKVRPSPYETEIYDENRK